MTMPMAELIKSGKLTEMFQRGVDEAIADHIAHGLPASGRLTAAELDARRKAASTSNQHVAAAPIDDSVRHQC